VLLAPLVFAADRPFGGGDGVLGSPPSSSSSSVFGASVIKWGQILFAVSYQLQLGPASLLPFWLLCLLAAAADSPTWRVQARGLIASPFSGEVISGFPVFADLPPLPFHRPGVLAMLLPLTGLAPDQPCGG